MDGVALWQERFTRIQKTINLEPVDQIPVIYMGVAFAPRYMGMSIAEFCANPDAALDVTLAAMDKMGGWDGCNNPAGGRIAPALTGLWLSHIAQPGIELPPDSLWQVQEAEVMTVEDYDTILSKGWNAFLMEYLPRVINPQEMIDSGAWMMANAERRWRLYQEKGYVIVCDAPAFATIPFEYLCGGRSMTKFFFDLYRMPDKIQAVMDVMLEEILAGFKMLPPAPGIAGAWLGGWRSASALVAPKLWDRFVWPYFLKIADGLIAQGIVPVLHLDQDWTRDLSRLQELPAKKCILNPDGMTDLKKFKDLAGDHMAMMGDIPASMLVAGTPDDIYKYTQGLIELFEGRGLLLCPGCDAPINARPENMAAIAAAAREFGKALA